MAAKNTTPTPQVPQLGDIVIYTGSRGKTSPAIITQTAATFDPELAPAGAQAPSEDEVSLNVMTLKGNMYAAHRVPREGSEAHAKLVAAAGGQDEKAALEALAKAVDTDASCAPVRKIRVRSWKPREHAAH